jgi:hypothetical protein
MRPLDSYQPNPPPHVVRLRTPSCAPLPKKPMSAGKIITIIAVSVVLLIVVPIGLAWYIGEYYETRGPSNIHVYNGPSIRVTNTTDGDWQLFIVSGYRRVSGLTFCVTDPDSGQTVLTKKLSSIKFSAKDPDAIYNDTNKDNILNTGDLITLKASGGHIKAGQKVQFFEGNELVGAVKSLP